MSDLYLTLKNGMKMPRLGMGTWMLGEHLSIYQQEKKALQAGLEIQLKCMEMDFQRN